MTADERISLIRVKIDRARKHICDLELEIQAFLNSNPYVVGTKTDQRLKALVYYLVGITDTPPIIAAITGDALFNLRAALDHLAYHLAVVNGASDEILKTTYFPIYDDAAKYNAGKAGRVRGMSPAARNAIDAVKPYRGGNDVLWRLHRLNIIDKHRILLTVGSAVRGIKFDNKVRRHLIKAIHAEAGFNLTDEEVEARNFFTEPQSPIFLLKVDAVLLTDYFKRDVDDKVDFKYEIVLDEPGVAEGNSLLDTLRQMEDCVGNIILSFKPHLG